MRWKSYLGVVKGYPFPDAMPERKYKGRGVQATSQVQDVQDVGLTLIYSRRFTGPGV